MAPHSLTFIVSSKLDWFWSLLPFFPAVAGRLLAPLSRCETCVVQDKGVLRVKQTQANRQTGER